MKRRDFIKKTSAASAPLLLNGLPLFASESTGNRLFDMMGESLINCGKVLVIVQQNGGNDGLNMIIPVGCIWRGNKGVPSSGPISIRYLLVQKRSSFHGIFLSLA